MQSPSTTLGIDRLLTEQFHLVEGRRVGLITNCSGVNWQLESSASLLHRQAGVELCALFGPEHGFRGSTPDGQHVDNHIDPETGVPVYSLYSENRRPAETILRQLDVLLCDIQDVGTRFYTYLYTMSLSMEVCAHIDLPIVVLDRPNPVGGISIEGNLLDLEFVSFVGRYPIPIRYGLTIGETARLFNEEFDIGAVLKVVALQGWHRTDYWDDCGLTWVPPSPNMPTVDTAIVYPGMCVFEGTNLSEGRGTAKPFEQVGAPYIEAHRLAERIRESRLPGVAWRPVHFRPEFGKHTGRECHGVQLHVFDRNRLAPVRAAMELLVAVKELYSDEFQWHLPASGIHNFDRLMGTDRIRFAIDEGMSAAELERAWEPECRSFRTRCAPYQLYS